MKFFRNTQDLETYIKLINEGAPLYEIDNEGRNFLDCLDEEDNPWYEKGKELKE